MPGLFDRLMAGKARTTRQRGAGWTVEELKDSVALALENLFNTRAALPEQVLAGFPEVRASVMNYGLIDFAGMCLSSDDDRKKICAAMERAIADHEPRLVDVSATLRIDEKQVNRVDFVVSGRLKADAVGGAVRFDGVLRPTTQQYAVSKSRLAGDA
ncbi:type VI secretion system baseplate subunit TssE [Massilia sp. DWR3-1-1]|uniref:type VI secretion system baseplate subunit TssE n=1 Tax=Massilia sp. DWR3-1-1 TaxID=2804559 RepID=UPI003CF42F20